MKEETKMLLLVSIITTFLLFYVFLPVGPPEPKEFVENRTFVEYSDLFFDYEITRYPSSVEIVPILAEEESVLIGFVVDPWNLNFGIVPTNGSSSRRSVEVTNLNEMPARISFNVFGNILPLVSFSNNSFILYKNEKMTIDVKLSTANEVGNYSGEIDVIARRPKYDFIHV